MMKTKIAAEAGALTENPQGGFSNVFSND